MSLLETVGLDAFYADMQALFSVSIHLEEATTTAVIGPNGAGKSTLLKSIMGWVSVAADHIKFEDRSIGGRPPETIVASGIAMVPEGRRLFPSLSVEENLLMGQESGRKGAWNLRRVYDLFPDLESRRQSPGTNLSGGQQQMVAIGRALMSNPRVLLCDELSLGLAPTIVNGIYETLADIQAEGVSIIVVEQDIQRALAAASQVYCLQEGRVALSGGPADLSFEQISAAYFGNAP